MVPVITREVDTKGLILAVFIGSGFKSGHDAEQSRQCVEMNLATDTNQIKPVDI